MNKIIIKKSILLLYMECSVCQNPFVLTRTNKEYFEKYNEFDKKANKILDKLDQTEFDNNFYSFWVKILWHESLLLKPGELPSICCMKYCNLFICKYCHKQNKMCIDCITQKNTTANSKL
uniref:Uncharacterized protein n=1 Tax=viral metagenome TaxID=1070528 RepID=A0A6C0DUF8_9ZZZZ